MHYPKNNLRGKLAYISNTTIFPLKKLFWLSVLVMKDIFIYFNNTQEA